MRFSFRFTLLTILLLLVGTTVLTVVIISYIHARVTADDLASQMLDQTAARIDLAIDKMLQQAPKLSVATKQRLKAGRLQADDFVGLIGYLQDTMEITDDLTGYFVGLESTGEATGITRLSGKSSVWQSKRNPQKGTYEVREFWLRDYPHHPSTFDPNKPGPDIRTRPWYVQARQARRPVWTETFVFLGVEGSRDLHGVTYATPVYNDDGTLLAVLDADFELEQLCGFFQTLNLGRNGIAFVIEVRRDGTRQVIAHPQADLLMRTKPGGDIPKRELIPPEDFPDTRVSAFSHHQLLLDRIEGQTGWASVRFQVDGEAYLGNFRQLEGDAAPPWVICIMLPENEVLGRVHRSIRITSLVGIGVLLLAVFISLYVSAQVAKPLERLAQEATAVGHLQFKPSAVVHSVVREVDHLAMAMEDMKGGLRSFEKYVPTNLVQSYVSSGHEARFGGERRTVTIFFSDIVNFTTIAEDLSPELLVERLREYLSALSNEIVAAGGTVDKYIGDAIMAFWGAPAMDSQHATNACTAALRCQAVLRTLTEQWNAAGKAPFRTRIGVHTGEVVVGNIGSDSRLNYTVIGDAVNLASRLEGLNKHYGTRILISGATYEQASSIVVARPLDYVSVKGKRIPVLIYELLGLRAEGNQENEALAEICGQALKLYREQDWNKAMGLFEEVLRLQPDDQPARLMLSRCRAYQTMPPGRDWDGVNRLEIK